MSYILEALKKSDQQRQRGVAPTLPTAPAMTTDPKQPLLFYYGLLAAFLLAAGIAIGWLRPWQSELAAPATELAATKPHLPTSHPTAPPASARKTVPESATPNSAAEQPAPREPAPAKLMKPRTAPASVPEKHVDATQEQKAASLAELPLSIQQEIPAMTIPLHAYSSNPVDRLVSINGRLLREGESLAPGLRLEQITPDGLLLSYKGYRFRRGVQ